MNGKIAAALFLVLAVFVSCAPAQNRTTGIITSEPSRTLPIFHTSTPEWPVPAGNPVPIPAEAIEPENALRIEEMARWMRGWVVQVAYDPTGHTLAVASNIGVYLYDAETLVLQRFIEILGDVVGIGFSKNGQVLASTSRKAVAVWDVASGRNLHTFHFDLMSASSMAFSPDGKMIAVALVDAMHLWDVATGMERQLPYQPAEFVTSFAFSPDGKILAAGTIAGSTGIIRLWDTSTGRTMRVLKGQHDTYINSIAFSPQGSFIASGSDDKTVKLWDLRTGSEFFTVRGHGWVTSVSFSPDGSMLASGSTAGEILLLDVFSRHVRYSLSEGDGSVVGVAFSQDGKTLASGTTDFRVHLWDLDTQRIKNGLGGPVTNRVWQIAFSPDGKKLVSAFDSNTIIWDFPSGRVAGILDGSGEDLDISSDGMLLAAGGAWGFSLFDVESGRNVSTLPHELQYVDRLALSPDGKLLAIVWVYTRVSIWDLSSGMEIHRLSDKGYQSSVEFSPDGKMLAVGGADGKIVLYDVETGRALQLMNQNGYKAYNFAFSKDGKLLVSAHDAGPLSGNSIRVWEISTGREISFPSGNIGSSYEVIFSPDGKILASVSGGDIILWDFLAGKKLVTLPGLTGGFSGISFSRDGKWLVSGSKEGTIRFWGIAA